MPKINHEEYDYLCELDDWNIGDRIDYLVRMENGDIALSVQKPKWQKGDWLTGDGGTLKDTLKFKGIKTRQIYSIAELIEEYEKDYKGSWEHAIEFSKEMRRESEETEVKTLESIREEIWEEILRLEDKRKDQWADIKYQTLREVLQKLGHLDEPEVLSQEWIDKNHFETENWAEDLYKSDGETIDYTPHIKVIAVQDLPNLIVPELPAIPKFVAEWIEFKKKSLIAYEDVFQAMDELVKSRTSKAHDWVLKTNENKDTFARAWLDGFTVKEEQKYVIKLDDESYLQRYEIDNKNIVTPFRIVGHLKEVAIKFDNKERAEKVAELVEGKVEELEE